MKTHGYGERAFSDALASFGHTVNPQHAGRVVTERQMDLQAFCYVLSKHKKHRTVCGQVNIPV